MISISKMARAASAIPSSTPPAQIRPMQSFQASVDAASNWVQKLFSKWKDWQNGLGSLRAPPFFGAGVYYERRSRLLRRHSQQLTHHLYIKIRVLGGTAAP